MATTIRTIENLYVIIQSAQQHFAVPVASVREMVPMPSVTKLPQAPGHVRGVVNLRGKVMPLIDLRVRLGMTSCVDEAESYAEMMTQREQDHRNWLAELEAAIKEDREFTLARDPHQCAFGKWYDAYDPKNSTNRCMALDSILIKFEDPHQRIHAVADQALELAAQGKREEAQALIDQTHDTTLSEMIKLFEQARQTIHESRRELAMILGDKNTAVAMAVDVVESVEVLNSQDSADAASLALGLEDRMVDKVARRSKDDSLILVLDVTEFLNTAKSLNLS